MTALPSMDRPLRGDRRERRADSLSPSFSFGTLAPDRVFRVTAGSTKHKPGRDLTISGLKICADSNAATATSRSATTSAIRRCQDGTSPRRPRPATRPTRVTGRLRLRSGSRTSAARRERHREGRGWRQHGEHCRHRRRRTSNNPHSERGSVGLQPCERHPDRPVPAATCWVVLPRGERLAPSRDRHGCRLSVVRHQHQRPFYIQRGLVNSQPGGAIFLHEWARRTAASFRPDEPDRDADARLDDRREVLRSVQAVPGLPASPTPRARFSPARSTDPRRRQLEPSQPDPGWPPHPARRLGGLRGRPGVWVTSRCLAPPSHRTSPHRHPQQHR